jgi:hypothetical protein
VAISGNTPWTQSALGYRPTAPIAGNPQVRQHSTRFVAVTLLSSYGLVQNLRLSPLTGRNGPNASMVAEFAYRAIRALQLIV